MAARQRNPRYTAARTKTGPSAGLEPASSPKARLRCFQLRRHHAEQRTRELVGRRSAGEILSFVRRREIEKERKLGPGRLGVLIEDGAGGRHRQFTITRNPQKGEEGFRTSRDVHRVKHDRPRGQIVPACGARTRISLFARQTSLSRQVPQRGTQGMLSLIAFSARGFTGSTQDTKAGFRTCYGEDRRGRPVGGFQPARCLRAPECLAEPARGKRA